MLTTTLTSAIGRNTPHASHAPISVRTMSIKSAAAGGHADSRRRIEREDHHRDDDQRDPQQIEPEPRAGKQPRRDRSGADHPRCGQRRRTDEAREDRGGALQHSAAHPSAVHDQHMAVHVIGCLRSEKHRRARHIVRRAPSSCGNALGDLAVSLRILTQRLGVVGLHVAGRDGVDVDAVSRPLVRERLRELDEAALRRGVTGNGDAALERQQ